MGNRGLIRPVATFQGVSRPRVSLDTALGDDSPKGALDMSRGKKEPVVAKRVVASVADTGHGGFSAGRRAQPAPA